MTKVFTIITACFAVLSLQNLTAQGCVAIRGFGGCGVASGSGLALASGQWQLGTNYRYFKSFRHFKSDEELYLFLKNVSEESYDMYVNNIRTFIDSKEAKIFSMEHFIETFTEAIQN